MHVRCLESMREAKELLEPQPWVTPVHPELNLRTAKPWTNSFKTQHADTSFAGNKSFLLQQCRVSEVIVFYPKPTNWGKSENNQETFRDQIFITRIILSFFHSTQKRSSYMLIVVMDARRCVHMNFYQDSCLGIRQDLRGRSVITPNVTAFRIAYHKLLHLRHT